MFVLLVMLKEQFPDLKVVFKSEQKSVSPSLIHNVLSSLLHRSAETLFDDDSEELMSQSLSVAARQ